MGTFYLRGGKKPILMVAGGTGLAPMVSMLRQMIARRDDRPVTLCFGVNQAADMFFAEELDRLRRVFPSLDLHVAVLRGESSPSWHTGFVTDLICKENAVGRDVYLCGPPVMTDRARKIATSHGVPDTSIFLERFLPSVHEGANGSPAVSLVAFSD